MAINNYFQNQSHGKILRIHLFIMFEYNDYKFGTKWNIKEELSLCSWKSWLYRFNIFYGGIYKYKVSDEFNIKDSESSTYLITILACIT